MSIQDIPKASKVFQDEFGKEYYPMCKAIWGELAKDSIIVVTEKIKALPSEEKTIKTSRIFEMQHIEACLGLFIERVYMQGRIDAGNEIAQAIRDTCINTIL